MASLFDVFKAPVIIKNTIFGIPEAAKDLAVGSAKQTAKGLEIIGGVFTNMPTPQPITLPSGRQAPGIDPTGMYGGVGRVTGKVIQKAPQAAKNLQGLIKPVLQRVSGNVKGSNLPAPGNLAQGQKALQSGKQALVRKISQLGGRAAKMPPTSIPPKLPGSYGEGTPMRDPVKLVVEALTQAKKVLPKQDAVYRAERAKRVAKIASAGERVPGEAGFFAQLGAAKGQLPKVGFESIRPKVSQQDVDDLFNMVEQTKILSPFEKLSAKTGLSKLLNKEGGVVPTRSEVQVMREVFPDEFMEAVLAKRPKGEKMAEIFGQAINFPRSMMATFDLSAPLRQGVFLVGRPKQFVPAFREMFKYAASPKAFDGLQESIQARPTYSLMRQSRLALTDMGKFMNTREEQFMSNWAEKIPGFGTIAKGSNRAYTGFLNKLRADVFDDLAKKAITLGIDKERPQVFEDIATFVNSATGRGKFQSAKVERAMVLANSVFFSPRLIASRLNLLNPRFYATLDPFVRREALKSLLTFGSLALTTATIGKLAGADVETNPVNSDFGKIRVNNTRFDPYGGFQQYIRATAQLIAGKSVSPVTGRETIFGEGYKPRTRGDVAVDFFRSKMSPTAGFAWNLFKGKDALGRPIDIPTEVISRLIPLVQQDMYDLYQEWGPMGPLLGLPGFFGVGSQTFGTQELVEGIDPTGEPTKELRDMSDLATDIRERLFGRKTLKPTTTGQAQEYFSQLKKLPKAEAAAIFNDLTESNPELAEKIVEAAEMEAKGISVEEQSLKDKGVATGDRAKAIAEKFKELQTKEEKAELWEEYIEKGIITDEVSEQIVNLVSKSDGKATEQSVLDTLFLYAQAIGTDPLTAFNRIFTNQRIRRIDNGTIIIDRNTGTFGEDTRFSTEVRNERGATDEVELDHIIPIQLGGSDSRKNVRLIPKEEHRTKVIPVENYLGRLLRTDKIEKSEAQQLILDFKEGRKTFEEIQAETGVQAIAEDTALLAREGNRPQRNNNPLNIKASEVTMEYPGVVGVDTSPATDGGQFLVFEDADDGWEAAKRLMTNPNYQKLTVERALRRWSNSDYGAEIIPNLANRTIESLTDEELQTLVEVMADREGYFA